MTQEMLSNIFNDSIINRMQNNPGFISGVMNEVHEKTNTGICKAMINNGDDTFSNKIYGIVYNSIDGSTKWYEYVTDISEFDPDVLPSNTLDEAKLKQKLIVKDYYDTIMNIGFVDDIESITLPINNDYYKYITGLKLILPDIDITEYTIYDIYNNGNTLTKSNTISLIDRYLTYYVNNYQHLLLTYGNIDSKDTIGEVQFINF